MQNTTTYTYTHTHTHTHTHATFDCYLESNRLIIHETGYQLLHLLTGEIDNSNKLVVSSKVSTLHQDYKDTWTDRKLSLESTGH